MEMTMYNFLDCEIEEIQVEITAEATVELKLEIPSGKYYLNGSVGICYEEMDDQYDYWLTGIYADVITEEGDDIAKVSVLKFSQLSDATKDIFKHILDQIDVNYQIRGY